MKIRLMGTREEIDLYLQSLPQDLILEASRFYPNRGNSKLGRCYLEVKAEEIGKKQITAKKEIEP